jgi:hypothetical protein
VDKPHALKPVAQRSALILQALQAGLHASMSTTCPQMVDKKKHRYCEG